MKPPVKWLLMLFIGSALMGCAPHVPRGVANIDTTNEPTQPKKADFISSQSSADYRYGMWLYRQSLIAYIGKLSDYVNQLGVSEGYRDTYGRVCTFPVEWQPILLPDTPAPVTRDPDVVNAILANYVRDLRRLIREANGRYADCVK